MLAVAVGLAPCLGMDVPKITDLPPKELEKELPDGTKKKIPNPAFAPAMQQLGEQMLTFLPDLQLRIDSATDAAEGLNVLYENMRKHRNYNFTNEFKPKTEFRRIGLIEPNRFGEYLFDNDKAATLARLKKHHELYFENKAATTGRPTAQLMKDENFVFAPTRIQAGLRQDAGRPAFRGRNNQGNGRGSFRPFRGGGRPRFRGRGPRSGRGNHHQQTNNRLWNENAPQDQPGPSGQNNPRGNPRNTKKPWNGGGGGRGGQ